MHLDLSGLFSRQDLFILVYNPHSAREQLMQFSYLKEALQLPPSSHSRNCIDRYGTPPSPLCGKPATMMLRAKKSLKVPKDMIENRTNSHNLQTCRSLT